MFSLGENSAFGQLFSLGSFSKMAEAARVFVPHFYTTKYMHEF
jgi:hypothetical protein